MKRTLSLQQKLLVLIAGPLAGALLFAALGGWRRSSAANALRRAGQQATLSRAVNDLTQAVAAEFDATWRWRGENGPSAPVATAAAEVDRLAGELDRQSASGAFGPLAAEPAAALTEFRAGVRALAGVRATLNTAGAGALADLPPRLAPYGAVPATAVRLLLALSAQTDEPSLRARFQELAWITQLADAADTGRRLLDANATTDRVSAAVITALDFQQWRRQFAERQLRLVVVPERRAFWQSALEQPAYVRADLLSAQWRNNATPGRSAAFPPADRTEWRDASAARRDQLRRIGADVAAELATQAAQLHRQSLRQLWVTLAAALAVIVASVGLGGGIIRRLNRTLGSTLQRLKQGNDRIGSVTHEMKAATARLSDAAAKESAALEETSAALQQLGSMNQQNSTTAKDSADQMNDIAQLVTRSGDAMRSLVGKMGEISTASEQTQKIIQTIRDIAFQTNILALNASIEAARAGDAGTGFKVVAEEIRELAKRAGEASTETDRIIAQSHAAILQSVELCGRVDRTFDAARTNALECRELTEQIRVASDEGSRGVDQIRRATEAMNGVMNKNVTIADENAATTESLFQEAHRLSATMAQVEQLVLGAAASAPVN